MHSNYNVLQRRKLLVLVNIHNDCKLTALFTFPFAFRIVASLHSYVKLFLANCQGISSLKMIKY